MTLTDEIHRELMEGLRTGLDYDRLRLKWEKSKGPFYNALQRVFAEGGIQLEDLSSQMRALQKKAAAAQKKLDVLAGEQRRVETEVEGKRKQVDSLDQRAGTIRQQTEKLSSDLNAKAGLLSQIRELEKMGFDIDGLRQLHDALAQIGTRRGLKAKESSDKFFTDLKDYDAKTGFEQEVQRLGAIVETRRLDAEKWQAKKETLKRSFKDLKQAISAAKFLLKQGVKVEQIVVWSKVLAKVGGVEGLDKELDQYKSIKEAVAAQKKEVERIELKERELAGKVASLREEKTEIEGAIKSLSSAGIEEIAAVKNKAESELSCFVQELKDATKAFGEAKAEAGRLERELTYARYLTADDDTALGAAPKEVVSMFLERVSRWSRLRGINPGLKVPEFISSRYQVLFSSYEKVALLDLMRWVQRGLGEYEEGSGYKAVRRV